MRCFSLIRASAVVNCQLTPLCAVLRSVFQADNSSLSSLTLLIRRLDAYSHAIDPHSYDVDPLEEGMAFKEQSLFACKQAVVQLYKDITFSFSWTLHRE